MTPEFGAYTRWLEGRNTYLKQLHGDDYICHECQLCGLVDGFSNGEPGSGLVIKTVTPDDCRSCRAAMAHMPSMARWVANVADNLYRKVLGEMLEVERSRTSRSER